MRSLVIGALLLVATAPFIARAEFESSSSAPSTRGREQSSRPWDLSIRPFMGFDDNVQLVPDDSFFDGDTSSFFGGLNIQGSVRVLENEHWTVAAAAAIENAWYAEDQSNPAAGVNDDHDDYNLTAVHPTASVSYRDELAGKPVTFGTSYAFRFEDGDIAAIGLEEHALGLTAGVNVTRNLGLTLAYVHRWSRFDVSFPDNSLNGRDSDYDRVGLSGRYRWDRNRRSISAGYAYAKNDADGSNFDYEAHEISAEFSSHLIAALWGRVHFSARFADYDGPGFFSGRRKQQEIFDYGVGLIWVFCPQLSADFFYQRQDVDSNASAFRSDRNNVGGGLTFKF